MIIGLGQKGPVEAGLALEHTWGIPMIPGSALKGLTMAAAHLLLNDEDQAWRKKAAEEEGPFAGAAWGNHGAHRQR
jgi:CRISPR-associated protein Cmr6